MYESDLPVKPPSLALQLNLKSGAKAMSNSRKLTDDLTEAEFLSQLSSSLEAMGWSPKAAQIQAHARLQRVHQKPDTEWAAACQELLEAHPIPKLTPAQQYAEHKKELERCSRQAADSNLYMNAWCWGFGWGIAATVIVDNRHTILANMPAVAMMLGLGLAGVWVLRWYEHRHWASFWPHPRIRPWNRL
jgi:hypothetical protein